MTAVLGLRQPLFTALRFPCRKGYLLFQTVGNGGGAVTQPLSENFKLMYALAVQNLLAAEELGEHGILFQCTIDGSRERTIHKQDSAGYLIQSGRTVALIKNPCDVIPYKHLLEAVLRPNQTGLQFFFHILGQLIIFLIKLHKIKIFTGEGGL